MIFFSRAVKKRCHAFDRAFASGETGLGEEETGLGVWELPATGEGDEVSGAVDSGGTVKQPCITPRLSKEIKNSLENWEEKCIRKAIYCD